VVPQTGSVADMACLQQIVILQLFAQGIAVDAQQLGRARASTIS
jgi:hypothetical protein